MGQPIPCDNQFHASRNSWRQTIPGDNHTPLCIVRDEKMGNLFASGCLLCRWMKRTWRLRLTGFLRIPCSNQFLRHPIHRDNQYRATTIACDNQFRATTIACDNQFRAKTNSLRQPIPCDTQFLSTTNSLREPIPCDYHRVRLPSRATTNSCDTRGDAG